MRRRASSGFTIVELLVVIAIIGVLVALLLPAIQAAREAGRNAQCVNQLKELAAACAHHEQAHQALPTGGWGYQWVGDPDMGYGLNQPGGWMFNILPYLDQQNLHDLGLNQNQGGRITTATTQLNGVMCPTRRGLSAPGVSQPGYPFQPNTVGTGNSWWGTKGGQYFQNAQGLSPGPQGAQNIGRSDYVANGGSVCNTCPGAKAVSGGGNAMYAGPAYSSPPTWVAPTGSRFDTEAMLGNTVYSGYLNTMTGVIYLHSHIQMAQIPDGASKTYLLGEKYLNPDTYNNGSGCGDSGGWNMGYDYNTTRWTSLLTITSTTMGQQVVPPARDTSGMDVSNAATVQPNPNAPPLTGIQYTPACDTNFGSAHTSTFNMAFCDGSVQSIPFNIDITTHIALGGRNDGLSIDPSKWSP